MRRMDMSSMPQRSCQMPALCPYDMVHSVGVVHACDVMQALAVQLKDMLKLIEQLR
jgi:kynureninase